MGQIYCLILLKLLGFFRLSTEIYKTKKRNISQTVILIYRLSRSRDRREESFLEIMGSVQGSNRLSRCTIGTV